ncbi:MAG: bifunctional UDP-N-acetylglucosamine diphosphorylase/glucosamine-1-phosphate N-acetyltransferase GlmU [Peptococcaceae bacterium]|nr:bifunctional UDP-N-acetylglucosamine diphosphorylase/glucosamine-1-phosphate N-acetyltransferase GlmU [Peptococcaceae bacterium]
MIVAGFGGDVVEEALKGEAEIVYQLQQLGTAHALQQAQEALTGFSGNILVLCGDTPLLSADTLKILLSTHSRTNASATVLTAVMENPAGYGRVIRNNRGMVLKIVEDKDSSPEEKMVKEINTGVYCFSNQGLFDTLAHLKPENSQGEYYLTDIIEKYARENKLVAAVSCDNPDETMGINDRLQLSLAESIMRNRINSTFMTQGVTFIDPTTTYIDYGVVIGRDTIIHPNTIIQNKTVIGENCIIGPFSQIRGATISDNVVIRQSVVEDSHIGSNCLVGPYSYIRPGCNLMGDNKVGDFVELKKVEIGKGSKIPHLSYVGDAVLGEKVNIGAGTITCNYDGENKWVTVIEDNAFIGSNTNLVAPVRVGSGAVVGAGSTITSDVPQGALGVSREKQKIIPNWSVVRKKK